jgi:hypothetical protein
MQTQILKFLDPGTTRIQKPPPLLHSSRRAVLSSRPEMVSVRCTTAHHSLLGSLTYLAHPRRRACPVVRAAVAVEAGAQARVSIRIGTRGR